MSGDSSGAAYVAAGDEHRRRHENDRHVGTVLVARELSDLRGGVTATAGAGLMMLLVAALGLAQRLQRLVSRPIGRTCACSPRIGREQPFEMPAIDAPPDETGELVHAFDDMMRRVGEANRRLVETNTRAARGDRRTTSHAEGARILLQREREASRLKDEFLATVSHQLRTPLNAILGWTQILQTTSTVRADDGRGIESLARNAQAQLRVIEDLLDISRIITGKLQLTLAPVDLRDRHRGAIEVIAPTAASRGIELRSRTAARPPCIVQGDHDRLRQVLWNLLSNALKFTPRRWTGRRTADESARRRLRSRSATPASALPTAFLPHVFERFRQADGSTTREQGGLGLGLAIVKELAELHGGERARRRVAGPGARATFTACRLPRLIQPGLSSATSRSRLRSSTVPRLRRRARARRGRQRGRAGSDRDGTRTGGRAREAATSGRRGAVAQWERHPASVLLCDLAMPDMDGFEVLRRVRAHRRRAGRMSRGAGT